MRTPHPKDAVREVVEIESGIVSGSRNWRLVRIFGLAGWSGNGKATLEHAHHAFDVDKPGKDSWRHREGRRDRADGRHDGTGAAARGQLRSSVWRDKTRQSGMHDFYLTADARNHFRPKSVRTVTRLRHRSLRKLSLFLRAD